MKNMKQRLSCNISIHEENLNGEKVFVIECEELGISDFGKTINEATENLRKGILLLLESVPEKKELLIKPEPLMVSRLFL
ncbi:MAG: hypothetical protein ACOC1K_02450 [Nanoarchaeota archaeon]